MVLLLLENVVLTSLEEVTLQEDARFHQNPLLPPSTASRPIIGVLCHVTLRVGHMQRWSGKDIVYTLVKWQEFC